MSHRVPVVSRKQKLSDTNDKPRKKKTPVRRYAGAARCGRPVKAPVHRGGGAVAANFALAVFTPRVAAWYQELQPHPCTCADQRGKAGTAMGAHARVCVSSTCMRVHVDESMRGSCKTHVQHALMLTHMYMSNHAHEIQSPCLHAVTRVHADAMFDGFTRSDVPLSLGSTREPLPELLLAGPSPRLSLSPAVGVGISLLRFSRQLDIFLL